MHGQSDCLLAFPLPVPQFSSLGSKLGRLGRKEAPGTRGARSGRTGATAVWRVCLQTMGFGLARAPWWPVRSGRSMVPGSLGSPESRYGRVRVGGGTDDRPHPGRAPAGGGDRGRRRLRLPRAGAAPQQQPVIGPARAGRAGRAHVAAWGGAVTAEGWRGPRVRGCGSAGVSPGCVCSCLAPEFVSLHRDVGVCHPEGCLRESLPVCLRGGVHLSVYGVWVATPHTPELCACALEG